MGLRLRPDNRESSLDISVLGTVIAAVPLSVAASTAAPVVAVVTAGAFVLTGFMVVSSLLFDWAASDSKDTPCRIGRLPRLRRIAILDDLIASERESHNTIGPAFDSNSLHVAVCGPAGSGKSSLVNALRGIRNGSVDAATTGTTESTLTRSMYIAHASMKALTLHDIPGAGTSRIPADQYFENQKLHLFDTILILLGERFGEVNFCSPYLMMLLENTN